MKKILFTLLLLAAPLLAQTPSASGSLTASSSTCVIANTTACVSLPFSSATGAVTVTLAGTFSATIQFEALGADGVTWIAVNATPLNSTTAVTSATSVGVWRVNAAATIAVRARCSTFVSGSVSVAIHASTASIPNGGGSSSGGSVSVNGSPVTSPNFNGTTPAAPGGNTNVTFQVSGSSISGYVPSAPTVRTWPWLFKGVCQAGTASWSVNLPSSNAPTYVACGTSATAKLQIATGSTTQNFWADFIVPSGVTGNYTVSAIYDSTDTANTGTLPISYVCIAAGTSSASLSFASSGVSLAIAPSVSGADKVATISTFNPTCAAGGHLYVQFTATLGSMVAPVNISAVNISVQASL